jgi:hypothetical protein
MIAIETSLAISAPPEAVWAALTDFASYSEWNPFVVSARGALLKGARLSITVAVPGAQGRRLSLSPKITVLEPGRMLAWKGGLPLPAIFDGVHYFHLEPAGQGGTHFVHGERFEGLAVKLLGNQRFMAMRPTYEAMNIALARRVGA